MNFLRRFSISVLAAKVALAVFGISLLTATVFIFMAYRSGMDLLSGVQRTRADIISHLEMKFLDHLMLENHHDGLKEFLDSAVTLPQLEAVYIVNDSGKILHVGGMEDRHAEFPMERFEARYGGMEDQYFATKENGVPYQYILTTIEDKPGCHACHSAHDSNRGHFILKIATDDLQQITLGHRRTNITMTALLFGGLGLALLAAFHILVTRPLGRMHRHLESLHTDTGAQADGKHPMIPPFPSMQGHDEISDLGRAFNDLVGRLNATNQELTDLHRQEIAHAERIASMGEMAGSLAHEIKNPIAGIKGALEIFDADMPDSDPRKEILLEMRVQAERIITTMNDLLSYARPASPRFERIDIHEVLRKTRLMLEQRPWGQPHAIDCRFTDDPMLVEADAMMLGQLFWNVMINGLQAMDGLTTARGSLLITTKTNGTHVDIEIADTGKGIPQETLGKMFKPFFTTKHKGTGLGLAISRRIVDQHGGIMEIHSVEDQGTSVHISLPLRQSKDAAAVGAPN